MGNSSQPPQITLITPMYNESRAIAQNVGMILDALEQLGVRWEYILVDDGSTDDSCEKVGRLFEGNPACRLIHYDRNRGRGYALRQGFAAARGRYIVTTESDLSWGPEIIGKLYEALQASRADIVVASVHVPGGVMENVPLSRRMLSGVGNQIVRRAFDSGITMLTGMTRGYRREVIEALHLEENRKEIHLEIIAKAQSLGFSIVEIPATIRWAPAVPGKPARGGRGIYRFVLSHLVLSVRHASVKLMAVLAFVLGFVGVLLVIVGGLNKIFHFLPYLLPYLVTYGLILCALAVLLMLFATVSIQVKFLYRSVVHLQAQLKDLQNQARRAREDEGDGNT